MQKIPTVLVRNPDDPRNVLDEVTPGCGWVFAGAGVATRKYDGTCVMFDGQAWWGRREVRPDKTPPPGWILVGRDPVTGKAMGWEPIAQTSHIKAHAEAVENRTRSVAALKGAGVPVWQDFEPGTYELCGPRINKNPEGFGTHVLVAHADAEVLELGALGAMAAKVGPRETLRLLLASVPLSQFEGIVWHHPDGRMAKIKGRDFPRPRS